MASLYRKYMRLLDKWPVDKSRPNGLAEHIRDQVRIGFAKGENTKIDEEKCRRYYESLERLSSNHWGNKYPNTFTKTASGLDLEQCKAVLSKEFLEAVEEKKLGFFEKLIRKFKKGSSEKSNLFNKE